MNVPTESHEWRDLWLRWLDRLIWLLFLLFAILLPHSIKGPQRAWRLAFPLWLAKLGISRQRPYPQPLSGPLLAYVTLSGISTALSSEPYYSWDRMKIVCFVLIGVLFAQNLKRLSQVRTLVALVLLTSFAAALYTGWQYSYGVGVQVKWVPPETPLFQAGMQAGDIITSLNGKSVHTPAQLKKVVDSIGPASELRLSYLRGYPFQNLSTTILREQLQRSGYGSPALQFVRGKPYRAQGMLHHYVVFAEMLMQVGCMAWAMLLGVPHRKHGLQVVLAVIFVAITATLVATETRAALVGLALGCFISLLLLTTKQVRIAATALLLLLTVCAALWILHARGLNWTSSNDTGTQFRLLMWEDGLRLVRQHPWFGVGMETVRVHWREWNIRALIQFHVMGHFHSTPLQIAVERGLTTLVAWLWFVAAYTIFLSRLVVKARQRSRFAAAAVTGVLAGFVAFLTTSLVHYNLGEEPLVTALFFFFGLAVAIDHLLASPTAVDVD